MSTATLNFENSDIGRSRPELAALSLKHWYAAYTCPRHEKWVAKQLTDRRMESFVPLYHSVHQWKDRRKTVEVALFPNYVFVRIDPAERLRVLQVPGVVHLVSFNGRPAPLPALEIEALRSGLNQAMHMEPCAYLHTGDRVRVVHGPLIGSLLTAGLLVGVRPVSRVLAESMREDIATCKRVILIGAGTAAQTILREISRAGSGYVAVGCLDDDRSKHGIRVQDVPVLGSVNQLPHVLQSRAADEVLIAVPSATNVQMRRFVDICTTVKVKFRTVPALKDIIAGRVTVRQLREVSVEDLLGRDPVELDLDSVRREITGRSVMVTGAAGSIGSELCRQILRYAPSRLVCIDQAETGLFYLRQEVLRDRNTSPATFVICRCLRPSAHSKSPRGKQA
jgi:transcription antitermination factor NusG